MSTETMRYTQTPYVKRFIKHESITDPAGVEHLYIPVETDSETLEGFSVVHASVAEVPNPEAVVIMPVSWSDHGERPFQERRIGTMADFSNARVICLDFPGMGDADGGRKNEFTEKDYEDLKNGRLTSVTKRYWKALETENLLNDDNGNPLPLVFWGNSLSTLTIAEMLANLPDGLDVSDVYFSEIMALEKKSRILLAADFMTKGAVDLQYYQDMNIGAPEIPDSGIKGLVKQVVLQPRAHLKALTVLTKGKHIEIIKEVLDSGKLSNDKEHGTRFHSINAEHGLSNLQRVADFSDELAVYGFTRGHLLRRIQLAGEYHGFQDSYPALLAQMTDLAILEARK